MVAAHPKAEIRPTNLRVPIFSNLLSGETV